MREHKELSLRFDKLVVEFQLAYIDSFTLLLRMYTTYRDSIQLVDDIYMYQNTYKLTLSLA